MCRAAQERGREEGKGEAGVFDGAKKSQCYRINALLFEAAREKCAAQLKRVEERREKVRLGCLMERKRVSAIELTPCYLRPLARNVPRSSREWKRGGKR